jgi:hypothetical protein
VEYVLKQSYSIFFCSFLSKLQALSLNSILYRTDAFFAGTVGTAIKRAICLHTVPDNAAATMVTPWSQRMNSALKAVKGMDSARHTDGKGFIIIVPTNFTLCHFFSPSGYKVK